MKTTPMLPPGIILLIGNRCESVQAIKQTLAAQYQVVLFHQVEKEVSWFNPIAVILHQNGGPAEEMLGQLRRLKQIKPHAPILLCHSGPEAGKWKKCPDGIHSYLAWPGDLPRLEALLGSWEYRNFGWLKRLRLAFQKAGPRFARSSVVEAAGQLPAPPADMAVPGEGLEACFFGSFRLLANGRPLPGIRSEVNRAMLACLLHNGPERIRRQKIIDGFWPDSSEDAARNCLNVAISSVRRFMKENIQPPPEILFRDNAYHLELPMPFSSDAARLLKLWERGQSLERAKRLDEALDTYRRACSLYTGDFLEGISRNIEWVESTRSKLRETFLSILDRLSALFLEKSLFQEAEEACRRILEVDDCIESAHRQLMICYHKTKRRGLALRQYALCCQALRDKLGAAPFEETEELYRRILGGRLQGE